MSNGHPFHKNTIIVLYVLVFVIQQLVFLHSCADRIKLETGMFHRRMYNACNYHNMHTINLLWMQIIAIYISIIPSTFKRKYTFIDDQMENSLHNMIPNSCHSSQEILRPCWWKSSPNSWVFANEIGNEWNLARPGALFVISEYNFGSFSLFCVISTVSAQHHQCDPITLVKAISWIHYSITCENVYAVIPSEYVGNSLSWFDEINGLYLLLIQEEFIYSAVNCLQ